VDMRLEIDESRRVVQIAPSYAKEI
jgi:hypothetical protein